MYEEIPSHINKRDIERYYLNSKLQSQQKNRNAGTMQINSNSSFPNTPKNIIVRPIIPKLHSSDISSDKSKKIKFIDLTNPDEGIGLNQPTLFSIPTNNSIDESETLSDDFNNKTLNRINIPKKENAIQKQY